MVDKGGGFSLVFNHQAETQIRNFFLFDLQLQW